MRVCLLTIGKYPHIGGKASHIRLLRDGLARLGVDVEILSASSIPRASRVVLSDIPRVVIDKLSKGSGLAWSYTVRGRLLRKAVRSGGFDIVHCHDVPAMDIVTSSRIPGDPGQTAFPLVLTVHSDAVNEYLSEGKLRFGSGSHGSLWLQEMRAYMGADAVIAVDTRLRGHIGDACGRGDVHMFPNFVDTEAFRPWKDDPELTALRGSERRRLGVGDGLLLLCPRRLVPKNGLDMAIRALAELQGEAGLRDIRLVLAGDGPECGNLRKLAGNLGVSDAVSFLGDVEPVRMPGLYAAADVVAIPSVTSEGVVEATSISALEAMACGLPVVASDIGGLSELLVNGETGLLFPEGDFTALARHLRSIMADPGLGTALGVSARTHVLANHSADAGSKRILDIYIKLLESFNKTR